MNKMFCFLLQTSCPFFERYLNLFDPICSSLAVLFFFFSCTWFKLKRIVIKYLLPWVGWLSAVGTTYWMACFTIKKETSDMMHWYVVAANMGLFYVDILTLLVCLFFSVTFCSFFFPLLADWWNNSVSLYMSSSCFEDFWQIEQKNGTLNTNLVMNHEWKNRSCCITTNYPAQRALFIA